MGFFLFCLVSEWFFQFFFHRRFSRCCVNTSPPWCRSERRVVISKAFISEIAPMMSMGRSQILSSFRQVVQVQIAQCRWGLRRCSALKRLFGGLQHSGVDVPFSIQHLFYKIRGSSTSLPRKSFIVSAAQDDTGFFNCMTLLPKCKSLVKDQKQSQNIVADDKPYTTTIDHMYHG